MNLRFFNLLEEKLEFSFFQDLRKYRALILAVFKDETYSNSNEPFFGRQ